MNETWAIESGPATNTTTTDDSLTDTGKIIVGCFIGVVGLICAGAGAYFLFLWLKSKRSKGQVATAGMTIITHDQTTRDD